LRSLRSLWQKPLSSVSIRWLKIPSTHPQPAGCAGVYVLVSRTKPNTAMKTIPLLTVILFLAVAAQAQPAVNRQPQPAFQQRLQSIIATSGAPSSAMPAREPVNYLIRVEWKEPKGDPKFLEVLTTDGNFNLDTIQKTSVKINNADIPVTLKFNGTLSTLDDQKGRLQLFLGRTVPYVTGSYNNGMGSSSSYSQLSVGLQSTFIVTFGKPLVIQNDESGQISVLVKRMKD
jgi:hypothetical protein